MGSRSVDAGLRVNVIKLPGMKGDALFGTVAGTNTRTTGFPFYAVRPGINIIRIPSREVCSLTNVFGPGGAAPTFAHFISVTKLITKTSGKRKLKGRFLDRVHRASTVTRIIEYFSSRGVARMRNKVGPIHSVNVVGARLYLTSLRDISGGEMGATGLTRTKVGRTGTILPVCREIFRILRRKVPTEALSLTRSRLTILGRLGLVALGPILCILGATRSSVTGPVSGPCIRTTTTRTRGRGTG